jgi:hypothetical protein
LRSKGGSRTAPTSFHTAEAVGAKNLSPKSIPSKSILPKQHSDDVGKGEKCFIPAAAKGKRFFAPACRCSRISVAD